VIAGIICIKKNCEKSKRINFLKKMLEKKKTIINKAIVEHKRKNHKFGVKKTYEMIIQLYKNHLEGKGLRTQNIQQYHPGGTK
jgi:hypothetical protein